MLGSIPIGVTAMADNVHEGDLDLSDVTSPEGLELPDEVTGTLDLSGLTTVNQLVTFPDKGLTFPEHVGEDLFLDGLLRFLEQTGRKHHAKTEDQGNQG